MASHTQVVNDFVLGLQTAKGNSMHIAETETATVLYSYATPIALRIKEDGAIYMDLRKYSVTTSKQQTQLRRAASVLGYHEVGHADFRMICKHNKVAPF